MTTERYDKIYARNTLQRVKRNNTPSKYFKEFIVTGEENLHINTDRQRIYIANHQSHMDYALAWLQFHQQGIRMPMIPAGSNLNQLLLRIIGLDFGKLCGYFINRDTISSTNKKTIGHIREVIKATKQIMEKGLDILIFPESGRSYSGELFTKYEPGIQRAALSKRRDLDIVPIAFRYDRRVEEWVMPILRKTNRATPLGKIKYYSADMAAYFITRPIATKLGFDVGNAYMNIGKPIPLSEIAGSLDLSKAKKAEAVRKFSIKEIKRLYNEISRRAT